MNGDAELRAAARSMLDGNRYVVVGTADRTGRPWVTPVFYTLSGYDEMYWVSEPGSRHSRNIAVRPEVSLVVFDSRVPVGRAEAVYMSATAHEVTGVDVEPAATAYTRRSVAKGGQAIGVEEVTEGGALRLYRAAISECWVRDPGLAPGCRVPVRP